jgi:PhnO protein
MIVKAELKDMEDVYRLVCELERTQLDRASFEEIYKEELSSDDYVILVEEENDDVRALMEMRYGRQLHHAGRVAEIMCLYVCEEYRNSRIGHRLFHTAVQFAREAGCVQLELNSSTWRTDAHRFYEREGMRKDHYNFTMDLR